MEFVKFAVCAVIFAVVILVVKNQEGEIGLLLSLACSIVLLGSIIFSATDLVSKLIDIFDDVEIEISLVKSVLKIIAIAYISEFASDICEESGSKTLGSKVRIFGKITVLSQTLPLISNFIAIIGGLL